MGATQKRDRLNFVTSCDLPAIFCFQPLSSMAARFTNA
jgi:hypothetical protein